MVSIRLQDLFNSTHFKEGIQGLCGKGAGIPAELNSETQGLRGQFDF